MEGGMLLFPVASCVSRPENLLAATWYVPEATTGERGSLERFVSLS
jgi:hypothetical protein